MILGTELRRSTAPVLGTGFVVVSLGLVYSLTGPWIHGNAPWHVEWTGLAQWTRYLTVFLSPLVIGTGAWQGLRDRRSGVSELFATTPKPVWRRLLPTAGAMAIALLAAYVVLLVVGGVQVAGTASYFHLKWLPVAGVMVLALVATAVLGFGIGRLLPSLITPPLLAVLALAVQLVVVQSGWPQLLTPAFESPDVTAFTTVAVPVSLAQAVWFTGIAVSGFVLAFAGRARTRVAALLPVGAAVAVAVPVLSGLSSPVVADEDALALVCDDDGPRVCVREVHADYLPALTGPARDALALMKEKLPNAPTSVVEFPDEDTYEPESADVVPFFVVVPNLTDPEQVKLAVLAGAGSPLCVSAVGWETADPFSARIATAAWFTGELGPVPGATYMWETAQDHVRQVWRELRSLPAAEQTAQVQKFRHDSLYCASRAPTVSR